MALLIRLSLALEWVRAKAQKVFRDKTIVNLTNSIRYINPRLFSLPINLKLHLTHKQLANQFWQINTTLGQELEYKFPRIDSSVSVFLKQSINQEIGTPQQLAYFLSNQQIRIFSTGIDYIYDQRDNLSWPTSGFYSHLGYEKAFYLINFDMKFDKNRSEFTFLPKTY